MTKLWCKIWNLLLNAFTDVSEAVAHTLKTVGTLGVELLTDVLDAAGDAAGGIFNGSRLGLVGFIGIGICAWLLLKGGNKDVSTPKLAESGIVSQPYSGNATTYPYEYDDPSDIVRTSYVS